MMNDTQQPVIKTLTPKLLIGKRIQTSLTDNKTFELWRSFMPRRREIRNNIGTDLYSMQVYKSPAHFENYNPSALFEKWAAVEVSDFDIVPVDMETYQLPGGLYAVFIHKGPASAGGKTFQYIYGTWVPASDYLLDDRPHFEILGEKYKNEDPDSEEEVWIPIKPKI